MPVVRESSLVNFLALDEAPEIRADLARNVIDLLAMVADDCAEQLLDVYDSVLIRLADMTDPSVRADIAARLAGMGRAPDGIVRKLAMDEIAIAYPLLVRSPILGEEDLLGIAQLRGAPHRRAIAARPQVGPALTTVLVERGDDGVRRTLAANPTAAFSQPILRRLVTQARTDLELQALLALHPAVPKKFLTMIAGFATPETAAVVAERIAGNPAPVDPEPGRGADKAMFAVYDFEAAAQRIEDWIDEDNRLDLDAVGRFAADNRFAEVAVALARLSGFGLAEVLDWFAGRDTRTVVLVVRALGGTVAVLGRILNVGAWRFRVSTEARKAAQDEFRAMAVDHARALLEAQAA